MSRFAEPYTLYRRAMKDGRKVYYYRAHLENGGRAGGISTGKISPSEAHAYCEALRREGRLLPEAKVPRPPVEVRRSRRPPTLEEWAKERHWYEWTDTGPTCLYCKGELARSSSEAPAIQRRHADTCLAALKRHILPAHGATRIDQISPLMCEDLMASLRASGLSAKSVNNIASVYRVMLGEAERLEVIKRSPWGQVKSYYADKGGKGILTLDEYKKLMDPREAARWIKPEYYAISLLASVTGLRIGECLALHRADVAEDHIKVLHSWSIKYGEGGQKTKRGTDLLPIPRSVSSLLLGLYEGKEGPYLFSLSGGARPCTAARVSDGLYAALDAIGIKRDAREARRLSFHSWRAFANTYFRAQGVPDAQVRQITRHETEAMTEHYSAFRLSDFAGIADAQGELVKLVAGE
jgi:integrase